MSAWAAKGSEGAFNCVLSKYRVHHFGGQLSSPTNRRSRNTGWSCILLLHLWVGLAGIMKPCGHFSTFYIRKLMFEFGGVAYVSILLQQLMREHTAIISTTQCCCIWPETVDPSFTEVMAEYPMAVGAREVALLVPLLVILLAACVLRLSSVSSPLPGGL